MIPSSRSGHRRFRTRARQKKKSKGNKGVKVSWKSKTKSEILGPAALIGVADDPGPGAGETGVERTG